MSLLAGIALGLYIPCALIFGFMFILGNGASSTQDKILSVVFAPGVLLAYLITLFF
ncbi:MAG: hypothetical protein ACRCXZ_04125 [Patescibacteria group bacterium]